MGDLRVLGAISGLGRGTLQGLELHRQREQQEEEVARQARTKRIDLYKTNLPHMDREKARILLDQDETLGDDDKNALLGIAGWDVREKREEIDPYFSQAQQLLEAGKDPQKIYDAFDRKLISNSSFGDSEKEKARALMGRMLGLEKPKADMTYDEFIRMWQDPEIDREGLKRRAIEQGTPQFLDYAGSTGRNPRSSSTPQGRTPEEIMDDQSKLMGRRVGVLNDDIEKINKNIVEFQDEPDKLKHWESERDRLMVEVNHLSDLQAELAEPDAKPFKNLKEVLKPKRKPKPKLGTREATKDLPGSVGKTILRKKAMAWLKKNAPDAVDKKKLSNDQIVENIEAVINQGLVK